MSKSTVGDRKIQEAKAHLAAQQKADQRAERSAQASAKKNQTTKLAIAGGYRNPDLHRTAFQSDLRASKDFTVAKAASSPKPAKSSTKR
jgi:hypothetical protein